MLSETPCQKRPFPITAKKPLLMVSEKAFSDQIFFYKIFRQAHPVGNSWISDRMCLSETYCLKWFCTPRRRQTPSGSTQETVHAALSQRTTVQQHTATTHTAAVSVLAYTHRSSTAAASLLGLLFGNTPCVNFVSTVVLVLLYVTAVAARVFCCT